VKHRAGRERVLWWQNITIDKIIEARELADYLFVCLLSEELSGNSFASIDAANYLAVVNKQRRSRL
jgi:hypothetical protein